MPVRIWGMLANGQLHIHILDAGEVMNQDLYVELIEAKFEEWLGGCCYLVQDFERAIRSEGPLLALEEMGVELVEGYPRASQDFNAIENCWHDVRERLKETLPRGLEKRDAFIDRLQKAVAWLNRNRRAQLQYYSTNQKERCRDCLNQKPPGGRTTW